jgi:hypothetical protein
MEKRNQSIDQDLVNAELFRNDQKTFYDEVFNVSQVSCVPNTSYQFNVAKTMKEIYNKLESGVKK